MVGAQRIGSLSTRFGRLMALINVAACLVGVIWTPGPHRWSTWSASIAQIALLVAIGPVSSLGQALSPYPLGVSWGDRGAKVPDFGDTL
jgi:hypothetical protein